MLRDIHIPINKCGNQDYGNYHADQKADLAENPEREAKDIRIMLRIRSVHHVQVHNHQNGKYTEGSDGNPEFLCGLYKALIRLNFRKLIITTLRIYFSFPQM